MYARLFVGCRQDHKGFGRLVFLNPVSQHIKGDREEIEAGINPVIIEIEDNVDVPAPARTPSE
jgi:hypothetical protein